MKLILKIYIALLLICIGGVANGQSVDSRLWGIWELKSMEQTSIADDKEVGTIFFYAVSLNKQRSNIPENLLMRLVLFESSIGVELALNGAEYNRKSEKGSFTVSGNKLTIVLDSEMPESISFVFNYLIEGETLTLNINDMQSQENPGMKYRRKLIYSLISEE